MQRVFVPATARRPIEVITGLEIVTAPVCALALLLHPTPLSWPALLLGALPSVGRWATTGRPWRASPFDTAMFLFVVSSAVGMLVSLDPPGGAIRLAGLAAALVLFAWIREHVRSPRLAYVGAIATLLIVTLGAVLLLHVAAPFLRLDRVPPLAILAGLLEPLGLYRFLVADEAALQRFRLYASGVGAVAAVGLSMTAGLALCATDKRRLALLACGAVFFGALLYASDNRGSMIATALTLGCLVVWWRPRLVLLAALLVFGTLDLIALGLVQRGFNLRTIVERFDFWQKGLLLAAETPFTGVGLGVESVQITYRAAFQPAYPPFAHAHNVFIQALLEQGVLGFASLIVLSVALFRLGATPHVPGDTRARAASLAACGGTLALLAAGLTEIVALTTVGLALLFVLLGLLVTAHDATPSPADSVAAPTPSNPATRRSTSTFGRAIDRTVVLMRHLWISFASWAPRAQQSGWWPVSPLASTGERDVRHKAPFRHRALLAVLLAFALVILPIAGPARPLIALPLLNAGTSALYRGTLAEGLSRTERTQALTWATPPLRLAMTLDPESGVAARNLALVLATGGDRDGARLLADEARARTRPDDRDGQFGIGRAYAAAEVWDLAIATWTEIGAGPQLLRVGRQLAQGQDWETGISALISAATVGAPPRPTADAITRAALAHGESTDAAIGRLAPLVAAGGRVEYFARLQIARLYRLDGRLDPARVALTEAYAIERDEQFELERGLQLVWREEYVDAEPALVWVVTHPPDPPHPVPDGDDARYWLAVVQGKLGRYQDAVATARTGLANLPSEQASLRIPYHLTLGDNLLAIGKPDEALGVLQAGQRFAPTDPRFATAIARARAARR